MSTPFGIEEKPTDLLFPSPIQSRETDERYTPRWVFDALGEKFDLDPASPPLGVSQVPTAAVWTKDDDGLTQPWHGFVWCNPPFSIATPWADRFMEHGCGLWLGPIANAAWHDRMTRASDAMILLRDFAFIGRNHAMKRSSMPLSMHAFGDRATVALRRFSELQPAAGVLLLREVAA
ncbi:MAG: hypothetical protein JWO15_3890 [Sphingomonadales bacterium]|nr:hypothetical protein [Sphingomonadales bacterium]